ncbi:transglutaminase domain-containing protein [Formosa agariphila KMM 3901]|uniref:Transglutaminase domain-containing protein n=1 Tax=Formosa agariphila (strain DSM 15362 / KCTC 12365 / LMG 23005 / KMM 3901 / M-2Alg 35-1) TaxID=1347342 RepID=T2KRC0_FORAG|nr:transglutaminase family protein [Formosa agariphila]CDF81063.1 transglutaminase domain-containing protein [Formosa agariphila KMM 3901]
MFNYTIKYTAENTYENPVFEAYWQYLVTPLTDDTQELISSEFNASASCVFEKSINGYDFETIRIRNKKAVDALNFEAVFKVIKAEVGPIEFDSSIKFEETYNALSDLSFTVDFEAYLYPTEFTQLKEEPFDLFMFEPSKNIIDNLKALNSWVHHYITFKSNETYQNTLLKDVVKNKAGDSPDFAHLFLAIARKNKLPGRFVTGYLHQGNNFFGDTQMHAWVEVYVPNSGWIGFDPSNNLFANHNHVKVAHGIDYKDCAPFKSFLFASGDKKIKHAVEVTYDQ